MSWTTFLYCTVTGTTKLVLTIFEQNDLYSLLIFEETRQAKTRVCLLSWILIFRVDKSVDYTQAKCGVCNIEKDWSKRGFEKVFLFIYKIEYFVNQVNSWKKNWQYPIWIVNIKA